MGADLSRYDDWLRFLTSLPQRVPALQVVVVNGSAVTGGWDEHSDLDVEAWCSGDAATTYDAVLALVRQELDVDHVWELPEATWPTGRQCFIHLQPDEAEMETQRRQAITQTAARRQTAAWLVERAIARAGMAERVEALPPGPDLLVRTRAAFAWQDEVLAQLTSRTEG
ncbi:hypothetical protein [Nocardioides sp.]|uniref:hypothetical protein n=1 Tax=Nocardioides sp. TaxID=35761 RepID=UPI002634BEF9|nr:hypothetical protein [Nocardioides sp.]MCW2737419.1 hypothetical protein [Nocardioides sp.]